MENILIGFEFGFGATFGVLAAFACLSGFGIASLLFTCKWRRP